MKLLLLSGGLTTDAIRKAFYEKLPTSPNETKLIIISIDTTSPQYVKGIKNHTQIISNMGVKESNISVFNLNGDDPPNLEDYHVVFMFGGNAFQIMDRIRKLGLDTQLDQFIEDGGFYSGGSAGAMILAPSIECVVEDDHFGLEDLSGFGWVDFVTVPHVGSNTDVQTHLDHQFKTGTKKIYLTDEQAVLVLDDLYKII